MQFFTEEAKGINLITKADSFLERHPEFRPRFDAVADLRKVTPIEQSVGRKSSEFMHVASICGPIEFAMKAMDPELLRDKRKFYAWLDANKEYCTYDRRKQHKRSDMATFVNGKEV